MSASYREGFALLLRMETLFESWNYAYSIFNWTYRGFVIIKCHAKIRICFTKIPGDYTNHVNSFIHKYGSVHICLVHIRLVHICLVLIRLVHIRLVHIGLVHICLVLIRLVLIRLVHIGLVHICLYNILPL